MSRELHRLETELNFLRTQPPTVRREPDLPGGVELVEEETAAPALASAPVYHADDADDDDPYTGGRAV
jgi:hypothetical protein